MKNFGKYIFYKAHFWASLKSQQNLFKMHSFDFLWLERRRKKNTNEEG